MIKRNRMAALLVSCFALTALTLITPAALSRAQQGQSGPSGELSVVGEVTVNGTSAISGATVFSDSTVTTAKGSSAVVSLGKLGRVEITEETTVKLTFDRSEAEALLSAGRVRVSSAAEGVEFTVKTDDGEIIAIKDRGVSRFTVDVTCGDTLVKVEKGRVELRAGSTVKQIAAGGQDTAGTATPGCRS